MDKMKTEEFWDRLDFVVKSKCKTYVNLAQMCGVSLATLYNNRSRDRLPSTEDLIAITKALETSLDWLIFGIERNVELSETNLESVKAYLNAPKDVRDVVDRIIKELRI